MELVRGDFLNGGADIGCAVVLVIPCQETGDPHASRGMSGRFAFDIRTPKESGELLNADTGLEDRVLRPWRNFADDRRRIADARRVIERLLKHLEMPVVKINAAAVGGLRRSR